MRESAVPVLRDSDRRVVLDDELMDFTERLAMLEEQRSLPWAGVSDYYCLQKGVPVGRAWFDEFRKYETNVLAKRSTA